MFKPSSRRLFNPATLSNVYHYLSTQETISFKRNESGFIRTSLPSELLVPDHQVQPLRPGDRLRINFWNDFTQALNEESIHDHPNFFQSYIINGGYRHIVYAITPEPTLQPTQSIFFSPFQTFQYSLDKHSKQITELGVTFLIPQKDEIVCKGELISMDPSIIHKVCEYHTVPNEKTLSLNIVRQGPKKQTHIFLKSNEIHAVKTEREAVSLEDTQQAHEELKTLFGKAM